MSPLAALDPIIGVIASGALALLATYLVAARRFSGKVANSDAQVLWEESKAIREWSERRIQALDDTVERLQARVSDLTGTITELREELQTLTNDLRDSHDRVQELEAGRDA